MAKRYYIHVGDRTTADGVVLEGLTTNTWQGKPNSYEGDKIDCRSCNTKGVIQCDGTRVSHTGSHGREAALDGDLCICSCHPPPRLVASQFVYGTDGVASAAAVDFGNDENNLRAERMASVYDQHLVFEDQHGNRLEGIPYQITDSRGAVLRGFSCADGKTKILPGDNGDTLSCLIATEESA